MKAEYIYAIQNKSFGVHHIKIGKTTREPDLRAREIYHGASGVPEPFDIDQVKYLSKEHKKEAFYLLLMRSMISVRKVLERVKIKKIISKERKKFCVGMKLDQYQFSFFRAIREDLIRLMSAR